MSLGISVSIIEIVSAGAAGRLFLAGLLDALGARVQRALAALDFAGELIAGLLVCWQC
jgi:hypothetical protein